MAGFQKFPVPKYLNIDFWNYNKKWIGNSLSVGLGAFLFWLSFNRYAAIRKVIFFIKFYRDQILVLVTILILHMN